MRHPVDVPVQELAEYYASHPDHPGASDRGPQLTLAENDDDTKTKKNSNGGGGLSSLLEMEGDDG